MSEEKKLGWNFELKGLGTAVSSLSKLAGAWSKVQQQVKKASEEIKGSAQRSKIDLQAWRQGFMELGASAMSFFGRMIDNSPALGVQFGLLSLQIDLLALALGEALAPILEPIIDFFIQMIQWVSALPEPFKLFIGIVIGLAAVLTILVPVLIAVQMAGAPLILIILAVILAIAAIIVIIILVRRHWREWLDAIVKFIKKWKAVLLILLLIFAPILGIIAIIILIGRKFGIWGKIVEAFKTAWGVFVQSLIDKWNFFKEQFLKVWAAIKEPIEKIIKGAKKAGDFAGNVAGKAGEVIGLAGGGEIAKGGIFNLHAGEKVLTSKENTAFKTLFSAEGRGFTAGSGGGSGGTTIYINNEINVPGGIFTDEGSLEALADMVSDIVVEKVMEGSPI